MRYNHLLKYIFVTALVCLFFSCGESPEDKFYYAYKIESGNTVQLKNGPSIKLIGIPDSSSAEIFLKENIEGRKIKIVFDSGNRPDNFAEAETVPAYIITDKGVSVNSRILELGLTPLDTVSLTDSMQTFSGYVESNYVRPALAFHNMIPAKRQGIKAIINEAERSVFIVISVDSSDNIVNQGSGFFIDDSNTAVSNYHVFEEGVKWVIKTHDNELWPVSRIIKQDPDYDYVVFRIMSDKKFPHLDISPVLPDQGEDIIVIGNPYGLENTVTRGVVSGIRSVVTENDALQIDAAISPGSSGSPVFNMRGEVVGIATMQIQDCENCNFAYSILVVDF